MRALLKLLPAALLLAFAGTVSAQEKEIPSEQTKYASMDVLVLGGETCAVGKRQEKKMLAHIAEKGWNRYVGAELETQEGKAGRKYPAGISLYKRDGVLLTYFHSKYMRSCTAEGIVDTSFDQSALLAQLAERLGRDPKIETPGQKYLFGLRGAILTVQIKKLENETRISLGVVRT
ncbi:MAG: hypothetical protein V3V15_11835 [Sphingorhabdus sp.]